MAVKLPKVKAEKTTAVWVKIKDFCSATRQNLYRFHYGVGIHTVRMLRRVGRWMHRVSRPLRRWVRYMWLRRVVMRWRRFVRRLRDLWTGIRPAFGELRAAAKQNFFSVFPRFGQLCREAARDHWDALTSLGRTLGPVVGAAALAVTILAWVRSDYCLAVNYQGNDLGVVDSAAVYDQGAELARERVINADNTFSVEAVPTFKMTLQGRKTELNDNQLCDAILRSSSDSIAEASGLYVDGDFIGAMETHADVEALLDRYRDGHYDKNDPDQRAEFVQDVDVVDGLFPISTIRGEGVMRDKLSSQTVVEKIYTVKAGDVLGTIAEKHDMTTAELRSMNPAYRKTDNIKIGAKLVVQRPESFLQVKMIKTIRYSERIKFKTKTIYRDDKPVTYSKTKQKGKMGRQNVVAEVTYVDDIESGRKVIKRTVTKKPTTRIVEVGTKKVQSSGGNFVYQGDGVFHGNMLWPVPICHNMSRGFSHGHYALDITNGPIKVLGHPAVAADGGTVVYAGWYYGYGNYVKIRHGNGLETAYAHLQSISVVKGQRVSRGQTVGRVGSTGNSTGPHLHFEVIKNGVKVNPLLYVRP